VLTSERHLAGRDGVTATVIRPRPAPPRVPALRGLTWVAWRQHRLALAGVLGLLGGVSVFMFLDGLAMRHAFTGLGLNTCGALDGASCQSQLSIFQRDYFSWGDHLPHLLTFLPGLIGVFVGAPLVARELESGTFRFAWTQGRSRVQWVAIKLILLGVVLAAFSLAFSALFSWWYGPLDAISGRMAPYGAYEVSGLIFAARTLFGFTLGALLGLLIRRTVPAMAATGAVWVAVVLSSLIYLRPLIRGPVTVLGAPGKGPVSGTVPFNADVVSYWTQDASGHHVSDQQLFGQATATNGGSFPTQQQYQAYLTQHHYTQWISYRPNDWFWHFQILEASGYALAAVLLAAATVLLLRRRTV
jgi:ABC-type transport system involved in multi-copper enzyme maturation permease subunit